MKIIFQIFLFLFPWCVRRRALILFFGYKLSPLAKIGFSVITADFFEMSDYSKIGHLNIIRNLNVLKMSDFSMIGSLNWIAGGANIVGSFVGENDRVASLILKSHSCITHQHIFDCTNSIVIGEFSTIAGYRSQFITHGINVKLSLQESGPIEIGRFCMIGGGVIFLKNSGISHQTVVGAGTLISKCFIKSNVLIAGVPGVVKNELDISSAYFKRATGSVD